MAEPRDARYPFSLNTGRLRDQWHGMSRTGTLGRLFGHVAEPAVQMHPQDMARRGLEDGDLVHVTSQPRLDRAAGAGQRAKWAWPGLHRDALGRRVPERPSQHAARALAGVNALTTPGLLPDSKQPELKHAAVKILKAELPWSLLAWPGCRRTQALARARAARAR